MPEYQNSNLGDVISEQMLLKFVEYVYDKNGKIIEKPTDYQLASRHVQGNGSVDPAGANDAQIIQIEVEAGQILKIFNLTVQSETGNKAFGIGTSTAGTFASPFSGMAGADVLFAGTTGTGLMFEMAKDEKPIVQVDNSGGSASLYVYIFAYTGYLDIAQVTTEKMGASYSGEQYSI